jgi:hypothetical protein
VAAVLSRVTRGMVPPPPRWPVFDPGIRQIAPAPVSAGIVTRRLRGLIDDGDLETMRSRLDVGERRLLEAADADRRPFLELALCVHHGIEPVLGKTGLSAAGPPPTVHSMARGAVSAGGSYYYADLVAEGIEGAGGDLSNVGRALDFDCSSGRVVRVLAAAFPDVDWHGCDPNAAAVEWAREHIAGVPFEASSIEPPLVYRDACFDLVFAISIWSHFAEGAALEWLDEMARVVSAGGHLVLTAQGCQSLAFYDRHRLLARLDLEDVARGIYACGFGFLNVPWGPRGDDGVPGDDWGMAFISPEWIAMHLRPRWKLAVFEAGRAETNQDLYVLERR